MEAFQQFLQSRGIQRIRKQHRRLTDTIRSRATSDGNVRISTIMSNIRNENEVHFSDSDDEVIIEDEPLGIIQINNEIDDDFDSFYNTRSESFGGGRNHNFIISDRCNNEIDKSYEYVAAQSTTTLIESVIADELYKDRFEFNIPSQDFKHVNYTAMDTSDYSKILHKSPSDKFVNSLKLKHFGIKKLFAEDFRKFKNNLSSIISDGMVEYLVLGLNSELIVFGFDGLTNLPSKQLLRIDTRPMYTSSTDRLISTWPYFPHTINYLKTGNFNNKQVLGVCSDDGTLFIWYTETIINLVKKFGNSKKPQSNDNDQETENPVATVTLSSTASSSVATPTIVKPDFRIKTEASLWGLDFKTYNGHNILVASDNSQSVVLLYYHPVDERFYNIKSHQILHNIPDISIVSYTQKGERHTVQVSCVSISGEIIVFEFNFAIALGPLNKEEFEYFRKEPYYYVDATMEQLENRNGIDSHELAQLKLKKFRRVKFAEPLCISRVVLSEDCWTVKPMSSKWFLPVGSLKDVFGDDSIDESRELNRIRYETRLLNALSGKFQFFPSKTVNFESRLEDNCHNNTSTTTNCKPTTVDDEYRRIHKELVNGSSDEFLLVSTAKKLSMFRFPSLFCNCSTLKIFDLAISFNEESKFTNRISISMVIPELLCFIAATQQGLITIMRLCSYQGVYGMRQEHIFPNALSLSLGYHGYRTIIGLSVRKRTLEKPIYNLYVTYNDGLIIGYQISI